jgi:hypothetical protein
MTTKEKFIANWKKWQQIHKGWERSGLSARQYCIRRKIEPRKLYVWKRILSKDPTEMNQRKKWEFIFKEWKEYDLETEIYDQEKSIAIHSFYRNLNHPTSKNLLAEANYRKWKEILNDWAKSGWSGRKYCQEKNIAFGTFYYWDNKIQYSSSGLRAIAHKRAPIIKDWEKSGLTIHAYGMKNGLSPSMLRYWARKLRPHKVYKKSQEETRKKWTQIMEEWQMSGLSGFTYCKRKGICASSFCYWRKKLNLPESTHLCRDVTKQERPQVDLDDYFISIPFSSDILGEEPPAIKKENSCSSSRISTSHKSAT